MIDKSKKNTKEKTEEQLEHEAFIERITEPIHLKVYTGDDAEELRKKYGLI